MVSPSALRANPAWSWPFEGEPSAVHFTKPRPAMKLSGAIAVLVWPDREGSLLRYNPLRLTGALSKLNSSNQSSPLRGEAIHSLMRKLAADPNAAGADFAAPGVGLQSRRQPPPYMPIGKSRTWKPNSTKSSHWPAELNK